MFLLFIIFCLSSVGFTNIIVEGSIFEPIRNLLKKVLPSKIYTLFECYQCAGTWCGFICGLFCVYLHLFGFDWLGVLFFTLLCGFSGSLLASFYAKVTAYIEAKTMIDLGD